MIPAFSNQFWDNLAKEYHSVLEQNPTISELRKEQLKGGFSGAPIKVAHYIDAMKILSSKIISERLPAKSRILDVGAYLNLFSDFINNFNEDVSRRFECHGIENSEKMCLISRVLFDNNRLIEGDVRFLDRLTNLHFDIIIFNNYFHKEVPFPAGYIRDVFQAVDCMLNRGGFILYKCDYINIKHMTILSSEGNFLRGRDFLPDNYVYAAQPMHDFWYIIVKN